jgi:hypothetical protein
MQIGYRYCRDRLIILLVLSIGSVGIFWDWFQGRSKDEPSALLLIAVLVVVGNGGLFILMRRAKRREDAENLCRSTTGSAVPSPLPGQAAAPSDVQRKRTMAVIALLALSVVTFGWNWYNAHHSRYYDEKIAFVTPLALVFAVRFAISQDDPTVLARPIPLRVWAAWALSFALGFANSYALSHQLY